MSLKPAPAVPNPISSPSSSSTSSAVVLITNATSPLARALARTLLLSWSPQALVLVDDDNDDGALAEVYEELVQLAWAVGDGAGAGAGAGAGSSGGDVGVQAEGGLLMGIGGLARMKVATTASLEFLHSYSRLLPEPVLGPNLPHPPIPRVRFGALVIGPACGSTSSSDRLRTVDDSVELVLRLVNKMGGGEHGGEGGGKMERDVVVLEVPPS
ncbi:unnamed protein product [Tilletia controversa]|uniref:Uncharacterized protein n=1 Tax=Tilletia controversa TaxID=13291 RepID=A0A8X7MQ66_9BASI|nr:hypothetical protein CF328_g5049 [Tilletia controversa]KAE8244855.1 hypothetical protein A4X06_0g5935 [Tilletia controversa]CAD6962954.1 unnamed protein product [Tilletia controversa]CAD6978750.1 unnamed protein product [Tilletia controversa]CAD6983519.1 unnamed protein product [Tilletia controversa]